MFILVNLDAFSATFRWINRSSKEGSTLKSLTTKKQTTKFLSANFQKNIKSKLYHIQNSKTRGQTVEI